MVLYIILLKTVLCCTQKGSFIVMMSSTVTMEQPFLVLNRTFFKNATLVLQYLCLPQSVIEEKKQDGHIRKQGLKLACQAGLMLVRQVFARLLACFQ